jgi:plastocyanin
MRNFTIFARHHPLPLVASTLGLLVLASGCGGDNSPTTPTGAGSSVTIIAGASTKTTDAFTPNPDAVSLASGGSVVWSNMDTDATGTGGGTGGGNPYGDRASLSMNFLAGTTHHLVADDGSFDSGELAAGGKFSHTFTAAGSIPYHCSIHPNMRGTITVGP